jgi:signal transduction histidine kinase
VLHLLDWSECSRLLCIVTVSEANTPRVLIVDDSPPNLLALTAVLRPIGAELVEAHSGEEAIELVKQNWFAAILLDVQMPGMDGFETAARIRSVERGRDVPIVFLTAIHDDERFVLKGYESGAADYVTKPFDIGILRARIKAFVDLFRQREGQRRQWLETALNFAPALVSIVRVPGYVCEFANESYRRAFKGRDVVGSSAADLGATAELLNLLDRVAASGETLTVSEFMMEVPSADRSKLQRVFNFTLQPLTEIRDRIEAIVIFAIDVTDEVRARAELELAREAAERANRTKDEFLATVSHELRTPLSSILGWAVLARRKSPSSDVGRALEVIERNARMQARLVEDILDVSRLVEGKLRLETSATDLGAVIANAVDTLRPAADAKGLTLWASISDLGIIEADGDRLQQVIWNLVSNAIKFTAQGGRVEVSAARRGARIVLRVSDTGEGIDGDSLPHLFRPFWQADATSTRRQGGLGLGLAIVSQIVHAHGGTIAADSAGKGKGTTMIVEMPIRPLPEVPTGRTRVLAAAPPRSHHEVRLDNLRLLVVDDDEDARLLLGEIFSDQGANVTCAATAFEAIEAVRHSHPDVVISDIGMPGMDGFTLMRTIRGLPRDEGGCTPAIALTAYSRADDVDRALAAGYQLHASKPVDPKGLIESVASLVGKEPAARG